MNYRAPAPLARNHDRSTFRCRSAEQTEWFSVHALNAHNAGTAKVWVVTPVDSTTTVAAYYAWTMASVAPSDLAERARRGAGRYPQPVALLARLGVDLEHERRGLGAGLIQDVIARTLDLAGEIGCRGLLIHAENDDARSFYDHLLCDLRPSPTDPLHLLLLVKDARRTLSQD